MTAKRRDSRGPGRQPGRRPGKPRKDGPIHDAVKRAIQEEIKGVPPGEILLHLRGVGIDTETARTIYGHVKEQVAKTKRRAMLGLSIAGAVLVVIALALAGAMSVAWGTTWYVWWILVSLLAAVGLVMVIVAQRSLRTVEPASQGGGKDRGAGKRR